MKYVKSFVLLTIAATLIDTTSAETIELVAIADATVESNGALGMEIVHDADRIRTSMSGPSNIRNGLYEFDLSLLPAGATVISATLNLRTADLISNTNSESPVDFFVFADDGILEISDQGASASMVASEIYPTSTAANTDLSIDFSSVAVLNSVISDGNSDDFIAVRTETENFVSFIMHSLESTDTDAVAASLTIMFTGGIVIGDVNLDCNVNLLDVQPFVEAVANGTFVEQADINGDGNVDLLDVAPFVDLLSSN